MLYRTAAAALAIEELIPFAKFKSPAWMRMLEVFNNKVCSCFQSFISLISHFVTYFQAAQIVDVGRDKMRDDIITLGTWTELAVVKELKGKKVSWTTDHWTGKDSHTYTTVTGHWICNKTWTTQSAVLEFKIFSSTTTGEAIYEDVKTALAKVLENDETENTIVLDVIGITDSAGSMGKLGQYLRDNGKEHAYCTDHIINLVAKLAFDREMHTAKSIDLL